MVTYVKWDGPICQRFAGLTFVYSKFVTVQLYNISYFLSHFVKAYSSPLSKTRPDVCRCFLTSADVGRVPFHIGRT